jgi:hypothetical protein
MKINEVLSEKKVHTKSIPEISEDRLKKFKALEDNKEKFSPDSVLQLLKTVYGDRI